jgi:hypothetical protein
MPLTGIRLLFETLVQCTRIMCKCERCRIGSKDCNESGQFFREPVENALPLLCCTAKVTACDAAMLDSGGPAS